MASSVTGRPGRSLLVLALIMAGLGGWMLVSGINTPQLGLDLQGGTTVTLTPKLALGETGQITDDAIDQAVLIIQQRVDGGGVAEASVTSQGSGDSAVIVVSVPGVAEGGVLDQLGQTASLAFRPVLAETSGVPLPKPSPSPSPTETDNKPKKNDNGGQANGAVLPRLADGDGGGQGGNQNGGSQSQTPAPSDSASPAPTDSASPAPTAPATPPTAADMSKELQKQFQQLDCSDPVQQNIGRRFPPDEIAIACSEDGATKYILEPVAVEGANVDTATAQLQQQGLGLGSESGLRLHRNNGVCRNDATPVQSIRLATHRPVCHRARRSGDFRSPGQ